MIFDDHMQLSRHQIVESTIGRVSSPVYESDLYDYDGTLNLDDDDLGWGRGGNFLRVCICLWINGRRSSRGDGGASAVAA